MTPHSMFLPRTQQLCLKQTISLGGFSGPQGVPVLWHSSCPTLDTEQQVNGDVQTEDRRVHCGRRRSPTSGRWGGSAAANEGGEEESRGGGGGNNNNSAGERRPWTLSTGDTESRRWTAGLSGDTVIEMLQDQVWRKDAGCQWESPEGERRDVGCQSEPAASRDAAVQVDFRLTGVWDIPTCKLDEPEWVNTRPPLCPVYPPYIPPLLPMMPQFRCTSPDLQHPNLARSLPSMPLYQPPLILDQRTIPLPGYFSLPMWNLPPIAEARCDPPSPPTSADSLVPPGLIAPLSPRLAEEEEKETEGLFLKHKKGVHGRKRTTVTKQQKKNTSQCRAKSRPATNKQTKSKANNAVGRRGRLSSTTYRKRSSEEKEKWQLHQRQDVLHPEKRSSATDTQLSCIKPVEPPAQIQNTSHEGGSDRVLKKRKRLLEQQENGSVQMMEEDEKGGVKRAKIKMEVAKQVVRPRRNLVGPPVRYLIESEVRSCGLSADDQSRKKANRKNGELGEEQQEEESEGVGVMEKTERGRVESTEDREVEGCWQPCQVCGLKFNKEASLQLHLSVHRTGRWFNCHLCSKRFRLAHTLCQHHHQHHHSIELGTSDNWEVKFNTNSDGERTEREERSKKGEETEKTLLLPPPTKAPDWTTRINRVRRKPWWWVDFQSLTNRRQENMEWWRRLHENDGKQEEGRRRKGRQSRKKVVERRGDTEEEMEQTRGVCLMKGGGGEEGERGREGGEDMEVTALCASSMDGGQEEERRDGGEIMEVTAVCATREDGGEEGKRRDGGETKEEVKLICVMEENGGEEGKRRDGGETKEEVKLICVMEENGGEEGKRRDGGETKEEEKLICVMEENGGEEGKRRDGGETKEEVKLICVVEENGGEEGKSGGHCGGEKEDVRQVEVKKKVMEQPQRPRRKMVGPPIRYLLESEEQAHGPLTANQEQLKQRKKTQKKSEAVGRTVETDRTDNTDRGPTVQEKANNPQRKRGRPKKVVIDCQVGGGASERQQVTFSQMEG
ncbi:hypothetical protein Q5P01_004375 [Channa striata]|uniref:C2H2-type domain-containing protein n=1 Tax=Channa striata TaxID=64152 RepID=A0AA88T3K4_CHASR|nr:hypothetical protein Q5P01_004375 [Channa striata]